MYIYSILLVDVCRIGTFTRLSKCTMFLTFAATLNHSVSWCTLVTSPPGDARKTATLPVLSVTQLIFGPIRITCTWFASVTCLHRVPIVTFSTTGFNTNTMHVIYMFVYYRYKQIYPLILLRTVPLPCKCI